jgi:hypothetical protein
MKTQTRSVYILFIVRQNISSPTLYLLDINQRAGKNMLIERTLKGTVMEYDDVKYRQGNQLWSLRFFQVFYEGIEETALCHIIKMTLLWVK